MLAYIQTHGPKAVFRAGELAHEKAGTWGWTRLFMVRCRLLGITLGDYPDIYGHCIIRKHPAARITLGSHVQILSGSWRSSTANSGTSKMRCFAPTASITIGNHSGMTGGCLIARTRTIAIGDRCLLGPNVTILDSDFHVPWPPERRGEWAPELDRGVTIENDVWIGMNAIILKGVHIGRGSIVAAGSVVTKNVPPASLVAGNPAQIMKRFLTGSQR